MIVSGAPSDERPPRNDDEHAKVRAIAEGPDDRPVPSMNLNLYRPEAPCADENFRLRGLAVEYAVIHRCPGDRAPLGRE